MKYKCPCCGFYTMPQSIGDTYDICPVCYWEDDGLQLQNPDIAGGANKVSLNEARENYKKFGACELELKGHVRKPRKADCICADITEVLINKGRVNKAWISLEGYLEVICGDYFLQGRWDGFEFVYWKKDSHAQEGSIMGKENMVAIVSESTSMAFVCNHFYEKFCDDTKEYGFTYIRMDSLVEENLTCKHPERLPEEYQHIVWINDDFLDDDRLEFDYDAFDLIDAGMEYLNPKHFSIYELARKRNETCLF